MDGASNSYNFGIGIILVAPLGRQVCYALRLEFKATNNEVLIVGLILAKELGIRALHIHIDSQLVVNLVLGAFQVKGVQLASYVRKVIEFLTELEHYAIDHIPCEENKDVDVLAKLASSYDA